MIWKELIQQEQTKDYFIELQDFIKKERESKIVYPPEKDVFTAFELCDFDEVKVVVLGQDPYHQKGQAMGLGFSVHHSMPIPKSLHNIFKELENDCGIKNTTGDLSSWGSQGVFLINTILTVEHGSPLSHKDKGWETFTNEMIHQLNKEHDFLIFVLWGKEARKKKTMISDRHRIIESSHPSPLSAYRGFNGSKPFSEINKALREKDLTPIDWRIHV